MPTPEDVFREIAEDGHARVPLRRLAKRLGAETPGDVAALDAAAKALADSGRVHRWCGAKGRAYLTLSSVSAYRLGVKLSDNSARWVPLADDPRPPRAAPDVLDGGRTVVCETDMTEAPPGTLARIPDARTDVDDDPEGGLRRALAEERRLGLTRPSLNLVGVMPWTATNAERPEDEWLDPADDPRRPADAPVLAVGDKRRRRESDAAEAAAPCPVCAGRPMRALVGLAPVRVGRNRAPRPPALIEGGECCARCLSHWQQARWPRVTRPPAGPDDKPRRT